MLKLISLCLLFSFLLRFNNTKQNLPDPGGEMPAYIVQEEEGEGKPNLPDPGGPLPPNC